MPLHYTTDKSILGDAETYLHRIGRGGRFGTKAISVTLLDRKEDKKAMDQITEHFKMGDKVRQLEDVTAVSRLLEQINQEEAQDD